MDTDRARVVAYRAAALGLAGRGADRPADLPVLDLGVQESSPGSPAVALAARTGADPGDGRLVTVWSVRGAPHLHRSADLPALTAALWPVDDADATARIEVPRIKAGARRGIAAFRVTAEAFRAVVTRPMPRGEVSTAVSALVPADLTYDCEPCGARHVAGTVFQAAGLPGAVRVASRGAGATLAPLPDAPPVPAAAAGVEELIGTYLRLLGPAGPGEVARYLGTTPAVVRRVWPAGLVRVRVDGRAGWLPPAAADALARAEPVRGVRLLPALDPLLQARDRDLVVPDRARQRQVWRPIGSPGVLLADGEVAGVWRARLAGRRLDLTVTAFDGGSAALRRDTEAEAPVVARARGATDVSVAWA